MQEHLLSPYQSIQCTPTATYGLDKQVFKNWDPYVNHADDAARGARAVVRHVLLQLGYRFYLEGDKRPERACSSGRGSSASAPRPGSTSATRQSGLVPTPAWRKQTFTSDWDRAWNPGDSIQLAIGQKDVHRDAAADGAVLRDDRERRQARDAVRRLAGRDRRPRTGSRPSSSSASRPTRRKPVGRRPRRAAGRPRRPLLGDALDVRHVVRRLRELPRSRSPARPGRRRRSSNSPATRPGTSRTSRGGAATGRPRPTWRASSSAP